MLSLPICRWRDELGRSRVRCRSPRFVHSPNEVPAATCMECACADHDQDEIEPHALPCVHLGDFTGKSATPRESGERRDIFTCVVHGRCAAAATERVIPGKVRACAHCDDYLPRDPFGPNSAEMKERADAFLAAIPDYPEKRFHGRGIVIAGGGDRYFASLYVTIRAIRHVGCTLPIQVWYLGRNKEMPPDRQKLLEPYGVDCIDADKVRRKYPARRLDGWELKVFASLHSSFEEVLFLDADCYPCRNPEFLFELKDYRQQGAIFWPDLMEVDARLKWPAFGLSGPVRPGSVESGQYLINKRLSWRPLNLAWHYNDHSDYYYQYAYGDKHTFEAAWTACARPYLMFTPTARWQDVSFMHIGPDGETLFVHRCMDKFRLQSQAYVTRQHQPLPRFVPTLPLERRCWEWLNELARCTGAPVREHEGRIARPVRILPSRIGLASLYTPEIAAYGQVTQQILRHYAARHGYRLFTKTSSLDRNRPASWSKIPLILKAFESRPRCEWIMWLDADALIVRPEVAVTDFLDDQADLIGGEDLPNGLFNLGVFFVRNCPAVKELLTRAYGETQYVHHPWWETPAVLETLQRGVAGLRTKIVPRFPFNVYPSEATADAFVLHYAGVPHTERVRQIGRHAGSTPNELLKGETDLNAHVAIDSSLLKELRVYSFSSLKKIRLGSTHDGGYVIPENLLQSVGCLFSVGVGNNLDFEHDFAATTKARIKLFDPTIAKPSSLPPRAEFFSIGLGINGANVELLLRHVGRAGHGRYRRWLKMDIEGWEWPALDATSLDCLAGFDLLIVEFHGLTTAVPDVAQTMKSSLRKINRRFRLIHAHGNNFAPCVSKASVRLPDCLEATFLRRDLVPHEARLNRDPLPGPCDRQNDPCKADLDLNCWPFREKI